MAASWSSRQNVVKLRTVVVETGSGDWDTGVEGAESELEIQLEP
jgi:hypothetical protein